jgi:hypothetical protein
MTANAVTLLQQQPRLVVVMPSCKLTPEEEEGPDRQGDDHLCFSPLGIFTTVPASDY